MLFYRLQIYLLFFSCILYFFSSIFHQIKPYKDLFQLTNKYYYCKHIPWVKTTKPSYFANSWQNLTSITLVSSSNILFACWFEGEKQCCIQAICSKNHINATRILMWRVDYNCSQRIKTYYTWWKLSEFLPNIDPSTEKKLPIWVSIMPATKN